MTTVILSIIGILLAGSAALMVTFYGGASFNTGEIGAHANTLQNAGGNVVSALSKHDIDYARFPALSGSGYDSLMAFVTASDPSSLPYLKTAPVLPSSMGATQGLANSGAVPSSQADMYIASNVPANVCLRVNKNLKVGDSAGQLYNYTGKMGCVTSNNTFFAKA